MSRTTLSRRPTRSSRGNRRRGPLALGVIAVLVLAAGAAVLWLLLGQDGPAEEPVAAAQPSTTLSPERAQELSGQLISGDEARLRQALVLPDGQPLDPGLAPGLAGLTITIDPATYQPTGADTATAHAQVTDATGVTSTWTFELLLTDNGWQVLDTIAQETP